MLPNRPPTPKLSRRHLMGLAVAAAAVSTTAPPAWAIQAPEAYTFLVLGLDTREENANQRSDVIMLARVDPAANSVRALSIPRDLWVEIPGGHGYHKINAAFQIGLAKSPDLDWQDAAALTAETILARFGVATDGVALMGMNRFPALIDAVGGVDVTNPYELVDPAWPDVNFPEGQIHLDGRQALVYTVSRGVDGDGGRVMRQHLVLQALLERLQEPEMRARLPELVETMRGAVRTDIALPIQVQLFAMLPDLSSASIEFTNIDDQLWPDWSADGQWIYQGDWETLPGYVRRWLDGIES